MPGSTGGPVRPIDPDVIRRIMADDNECPDCATLGHICRPCRRTRYEARAAPTGWRARLLRVVTR